MVTELVQEPTYCLTVNTGSVERLLDSHLSSGDRLDGGGRSQVVRLLGDAFALSKQSQGQLRPLPLFKDVVFQPLLAGTVSNPSLTGDTA